jgi:Domain of unknown function (DUF1707)
MPPDPRIRASDEDRDRAASLLREHHAVGRLTPEEFSDRLDQVYAAKTMGELDEILVDLPGIDLYRLPDAALPRYRAPVAGHDSLPSVRFHDGQVTPNRGRFSARWGAAWGSWLSTSLVLIVIWALSGAGYPWFLWVVGPWGALMLADWVSGGIRRGHGNLGPGRSRDQLGDGSQDR